jgi:hypothetical protein
MFTNHHIAIQLAAERQRDLRAAKGDRQSHDRFAPAGAEPARDGDFSAPALGEVRFPAIVASRDPHLPEPRIRRNAAGQSAARTPVARERRESRHGDARVGS